MRFKIKKNKEFDSEFIELIYTGIKNKSNEIGMNPMLNENLITLIKMTDLKGYKILKYTYPFNTDQLEDFLWDKMSEQDSKWAIKLTLEGINETGGDDRISWDIFFLDDKLKKKIEDILKKYEVPYESEDITKKLIKDTKEFSDKFLEKLQKFLSSNLSVDDVLDNIIEIGFEKITIFEKYYLDTNTEPKKEE